MQRHSAQQKRSKMRKGSNQHPPHWPYNLIIIRKSKCLQRMLECSHGAPILVPKNGSKSTSPAFRWSFLHLPHPAMCKKRITGPYGTCLAHRLLDLLGRQGHFEGPGPATLGMAHGWPMMAPMGPTWSNGSNGSMMIHGWGHRTWSSSSTCIPTQPWNQQGAQDITHVDIFVDIILFQSIS